MSREVKAGSLDYLSGGGSILVGHTDELKATRGNVEAVSRGALAAINSSVDCWVMAPHRDAMASREIPGGVYAPNNASGVRLMLLVIRLLSKGTLECRSRSYSSSNLLALTGKGV